MRKSSVLLLGFLVLLLFCFCAKKPKVTEEKKPPTTKTEETTPPETGKEEVTSKVITQDDLSPIYFDFDKYDLRDDTIATLKENGEWLRKNSQYAILLEGHCDERGTIEYNLELGAKRAGAVKSYLIGLGLPEERFKTISYGEERPADSGHGEEAWARNRRAEFLIEK